MHVASRMLLGPWLAIAIGTLVTCTPSPSGAQRSGRSLHVDVTYAGASDGSTARPFATIQAAIDAARDGDTIKVAQGRYDHGNVDLRSKALVLLGGFAGRGDFTTRDPARFRTVVVGRRDTKDYEKDRAAVFYWVASAGGTIDGFTITGGRHGIFTSYTTSEEPLVITNNVIEDNGVDKPDYYEHGGGIHTEYKNVRIEKNVIRRNKSGRGGGLAVLGSGKAHIEGNVVEENVGLGDHGGGAFVAQAGVVKDNVFRKNEVTGAIVSWVGGVGGGLIVLSAEVELTGNRITENYAKKCGGGLFVDEGARVEMHHDLVFRNRPAHPNGWGGSAIYVDGGKEKSTLSIRHVTVADNAPNGPGKGNGIFVAVDGEVTVKSSIFSNNGPTEMWVDDPEKSFIDVAHSITRAEGRGIRLGPGVLRVEPAFGDREAGDYHLKSRAGRWKPLPGGSGEWVIDVADSPGIDAADPSAPFDREPAPNGGRANLGRYGNTAQASRSSSGKETPIAPTGAAEPAPASAPAAVSASAPVPAATDAPASPTPARPGCAGCTVGSGTDDVSVDGRPSHRDLVAPLFAILAALFQKRWARRRARAPSC